MSRCGQDWTKATGCNPVIGGSNPSTDSIDENYLRGPDE